MSKRELLQRTVGKGILWALLIILLATNVFLARTDKWQQILSASTNHPVILSLVNKITNVLGAQTPEANDENETMSSLENEYIHWQQVVRDHPDYRDAFFRLALLAYRMGYFEESKSYLEIVRGLDPNFPGIANLEALLANE